MKFSTLKYRSKKEITIFTCLLFILFSSLFIFFTGCDDETGTIDPESGSIGLKMVWISDLDVVTRSQLTCDDVGVVQVFFYIYDEKMEKLDSASWPCSAGHGVLDKVKFGDNRTLKIYGIDSDGREIYYAEKGGISVKKGEYTYLGVLEMKPINYKPVVKIDSPSDGSVFYEGQTISFSGSGTDLEDGVLGGNSLIWDSTINGRIGVGNTLNINTLSVGTHTIYLTATDSGKASQTNKVVIQNQSAAIIIHVKSNQAPVVKIDFPSDNSSFTKGKDTIKFSGTAIDAEDGVLSGSSLVWDSSINGRLGTGNLLEVNNLSVGVHTIYLTACDSYGSKQTVSIKVTIRGDESDAYPPVANAGIDKLVYQGENVILDGSVSSDADGQIVSYQWTQLDPPWPMPSSTKVTISKANSVQASFVAPSPKNGDESLTFQLKVIDNEGYSSTDTVVIKVLSNVSSNSLPSVTINSPSNNSSFKQGASISFSGSATDQEDGTLTGNSLVWTSSIDGQLGSGTSLSKNSLTVGTHTITLIATDSSGGKNSSSITVVISAKPNTLPSVTI
ncbi:MAG: hypothetical protein HQK76_10115, partial [Desulfobacterales bacterium]|nr:hypothetical protein [Desulfobacterales bacterium]